MEKEIVLQFRNYKLFSKKEFNLGDYRAYFVSGGNEKGKSTIITALQEMFGISAHTTDPVTTGAAEGSKTFQIPDKNGDMVTVKHTYDRGNARGKFVVFDKNGTPIRKVGEMRELLGSYSRITTEQFFDMARTAEGRRRIISEYFIQFLTEDELSRLKKLQDTEGVNYDLRAEAKKELDVAEKRLQDNKPTPSDEQLMEQKVKSQKLLATLREQRDGVKFSDSNMKVLAERDRNLKASLEVLQSNLKNDIQEAEEDAGEWEAELVELERRVAELKRKIAFNKKFLANPTEDYKDKIDGLKKQILENDKEIEKLKEETTDPDMTLEQLDTRIEKGEELLSNIAVCESRKENYTKTKQEHEEVEERWKTLDKKIQHARDGIKKLYASSALPSGVQIEDDTFTLNGFEFSETQISESKAKLVIAEIMCQVDTSPLLVMGNAGTFGQERLNELCALAEKHNKIMFLEKVEDDAEDVRVVGVVYNKELKTDDKLF